ncbi:LytR/AlgR family response regulator transcription factor [Spirosoma pomorum]
MIVHRVNLQKRANSILYLSGKGNYTNVHFDGKKTELYSLTLARFCEDLPGFIRIHKAYLVNPQYIQAYIFYPITQARVLVGDTWLPISRRRIQEVRTQLTLALSN